jgi:hypothetical protein
VQEGRLAPPPQPQRPTNFNLSKDGFDRMLDKIMHHFTSESPRTKAKINAWQGAAQLHNEVRALLPPQFRNEGRSEGDASGAPQDPSLAFFPPEWSQNLSEELVAELLVDAFTSAFADAFLDGAISLVEVSSKFNAASSTGASGIQHSHSEPTLREPQVSRRLRSDKVLHSMELDAKGKGSKEGFTMAGLPKDPWEAWNAREYHRCKSLDPLTKRIGKATEAQRPSRYSRETSSPFVTQRSGDTDHRKYVWPMAATNFPAAWHESTRGARSQLRDITENDCPRDGWLIRVKNDQTYFPYSLVSHRAFHDSQQTPLLKEKARKLAPLRLSSTFS